MDGAGEDGRDRIAVVLVRARNPSNIGAVARAMHDFGFGRLRIVNEFAVPFAAARSAVDAGEVMAAAAAFASVAEAVADCSLVVGTTAVGDRAIEHPLYALHEAAKRISEQVSSADGGRVALLFGSEKTGLSNEELSHCHCLLTIPMQQYDDLRHPSMNLGQAVAVCLYELAREVSPLPVAARKGDVAAASGAPAGGVERMTDLLLEVLHAAEYDRHHPANSDDEAMRRMVLRMRISRVDLPVWMGLLRQVLWKLRGGVRS